MRQLTFRTGKLVLRGRRNLHRTKLSAVAKKVHMRRRLCGAKAKACHLAQHGIVAFRRNFERRQAIAIRLGFAPNRIFDWQEAFA